jgi:hypothetical protein
MEAYDCRMRGWRVKNDGGFSPSGFQVFRLSELPLSLVGGVAHAWDAAFPVGGAAPRDGGIAGIGGAAGENGSESEGEECQKELFHDENDAMCDEADARRIALNL